MTKKFFIATCPCGCKTKHKVLYEHRNRPGYIMGHHSKSRIGFNNPTFKGGLVFNKPKNRWQVGIRGGGYIYFSRVIMGGVVRRELRRSEIVHHKDGITTNDNASNLEIMTNAQHTKLHNPRGNKSQFRHGHCTRKFKQKAKIKLESENV